MSEAFDQIVTIANATGKLKADGIPVSLVQQLSAPEKKQVEELLIRMVQAKDLSGLEALAALHTDNALKTIQTLFDQTDPHNILQIKLAKLLWETTHEARYLSVVLGDFKPKDNTEKLSLIATYLQLPPQTVPDEKFVAIIQHETYRPMRFQAGKGLLYNHHILPRQGDVPFGDPLHQLLQRLSDEDSATRNTALEEVYKLAQR